MSNSNFQQRAKVGVAGSFFNQLMANNQSIPEVGKGATELHYSDRTCYEVIASRWFGAYYLEYLKDEGCFKLSSKKQTIYFKYDNGLFFIKNVWVINNKCYK